MDSKNLSSRQDCWAQELTWYPYWIDYRQKIEKTAANACQRSQAKKKTFRDENFQIFQCLQASLIRAIIAEFSLSA